MNSYMYKNKESLVEQIKNEHNEKFRSHSQMQSKVYEILRKIGFAEYSGNFKFTNFDKLPEILDQESQDNFQSLIFEEFFFECMSIDFAVPSQKSRTYIQKE